MSIRAVTERFYTYSEDVVGCPALLIRSYAILALNTNTLTYYYIYCCCIAGCRLDLKTLSAELVEIILRVIPTDQEIKLYREYEADGKPVEVLADEDKFMLSVSVHLLQR